MQQLTLERASSIVGFAEDEFARASSIDDAYAPFHEGGATSRLEARHALLLVVAEIYQRDTWGIFEDYAKLSRSISTRIMCDALRGSAEFDRVALHLGRNYDDFVSFLTRLDPTQANYFQSVYERLGIQNSPDSTLSELQHKFLAKLALPPLRNGGWMRYLHLGGLAIFSIGFLSGVLFKSPLIDALLWWGIVVAIAPTAYLFCWVLVAAVWFVVTYPLRFYCKASIWLWERRGSPATSYEFRVRTLLDGLESTTGWFFSRW